MNYIVFDLEWNQSPGGKNIRTVACLFEIIEIGAVKMNEERETCRCFSETDKTTGI